MKPDSVLKGQLMRRQILFAGIIVFLTGCGKKPESSEGMPPGGMPPQEVAVVTLTPQRAEIVTELPGRTAACRIAEVRPQVSGIILKRLFAEGAEVKLGEQ
ncbi:MAG: hypothetical protein WC076_11655, partial [Terrimicrobiaceae bacterium]